uniref:helix-turn-helix transcriptional regulator n=1 Tax=Anaerococcus mediterraneensis TaxID=1870984 RepID=UPI000AC6191D|nr:helix-turn-helix domain-containing protein [Anaerococcus mediterraneensis]
MVVIPENNIRVLRAMENVSQKELAEAVGVTQQTISTAENTSRMSLTTAKKIADYFGVGIDDIFLSKNTRNNCKNI